MYHTTNPATGERLRAYPLHSPSQVQAALVGADAGFRQWRRSSFAERRTVLEQLAALLDAEKERHAATLTTEMGKTLVSAVAEVEKCASACRWYAQHAEALLMPERVELPSGVGEVRHLPLGVVFAIMPWNFPFWQVIRFLAPALMAGNAAILKHAPSTPGSALALVDLLARAGLPDGVFQTLFLDNDQAAAVIADRRIAAVTLTGSERAGEAVGATSGRSLKPCVLELGGSDPLIVMPSADFDAALRGAVVGRNQNNGQSCVCAKRILVHSAIYDRFRDALVAATATLRVGDPMARDTDIGPLSTIEARDRLAEQVQRAIADGGKLLVGGRAPEGPGAYYLPSVIAAAPPGSESRLEELFGPVALLFSFADIDEAIRIANETPFGLGSSVWTTEPGEQARFAAELECGMTFFNAITASDPRLPFGGIKRSGVGRELGKWGMLEFVNVRTVVTAA